MPSSHGISDVAISSDEPVSLPAALGVPTGAISTSAISGAAIAGAKLVSYAPPTELPRPYYDYGAIAGTSIAAVPISSLGLRLPILSPAAPGVGSISSGAISFRPISSGYEFIANEARSYRDYGAIAGVGISCVPISSLGQVPVVTDDQTVRASIVFAPLAVAGRATYDINVSGRAGSITKGAWQVADQTEQGPQSAWGATLPVHAFDRSTWGAADPLPNGFEFHIGNLLRFPKSQSSRWQEADKAHWLQLTTRWQDMDRLRLERHSGWQEADPIGIDLLSRFQEMIHTSRARVQSRYQEAVVLDIGRQGRWQVAKPYEWGRKSRYQLAMRPPPGISPHIGPPIEPPPELCYTPPTSPIAMIFDAQWLNIDHSVLLFVCENHPVGGGTIVVPVRRVYMITNSATLTRIEGGIALPVLGMTLQIDMDSWAWGFSATVAGIALDDLQPNSNGDPIELLATINGVAYRVIAERVARVRTFGKTGLQINGRGRSALLDTPYVPILTFGNSDDRLAQQLAGDVLTDNGTSIGWDVDWQLTDWLVQGGVWTKQGSYIDGLKEIAAAAGGYLQPHRTDQEISFLAKYPVAPWDWGTVIPDFELPTAVTQQESIEWLDKALYNRVYVSGQNAGILARVTRYGTAGELVAPMVTDALITASEAAEQRGRAVLSDTGRQANVTLRLPVLPATGIIPPGKFVKYVDGSITRLGLVRSVSVETGRPDIWQNLLVETHDA